MQTHFLQLRWAQPCVLHFATLLSPKSLIFYLRAYLDLKSSHCSSSKIFVELIVNEFDLHWTNFVRVIWSRFKSTRSMLKSSFETTITSVEKKISLNSTSSTSTHHFTNSNSSYHSDLRTEHDQLLSDLFPSCLPSSHKDSTSPRFKDDSSSSNVDEKIWTSWNPWFSTLQNHL